MIRFNFSFETTRGAKQYSTTTTESFSGPYFDDPQKRESILRFC